MTEQTTGAVDHGAQPDGLTNAEKLTALQTYLKALKPMEEHLRVAALADMQAARAERVGAYLPDGEKIGTVGLNKGRKSARVTDDAAALTWVEKNYPEAIRKSINPAWLKALTDYAAEVGQPGEPGVDPRSGEVLPFIEVRQGNPFLTVTTTKEGVARMTELAHGFAGMLEAPTAADEQLDDLLQRANDAVESELNDRIDVEARLADVLRQARTAPAASVWVHDDEPDAPLQPGWPTHVRAPRGPDFDPGFADRMGNGAYGR